MLTTLLEKSPTALLGLKQNYLAAERMTFADFVDYEAERHLEIAASERHGRGVPGVRREAQAGVPMTWIRLRQVALVAHDLDAVLADLGRELGLEVAFNDPGVATFGLRNAVLPVGTQFVEVVSPITEGTAAGRQLERLGGDGGYMVICHTDDHESVRARTEALGIRKVLEADDHGYKIMQLHPSDTGGSFLEIDFQPGGDDPNGPWMPAGPDWQRAVRTDVVDGITGVELRVPGRRQGGGALGRDPRPSRRRWRDRARQRDGAHRRRDRWSRRHRYARTRATARVGSAVSTFVSGAHDKG